MPRDPGHIARRLVELRERHSPPLDQEGAAQLIGVSLRRYGDWERSLSTPSLKNVTKIARAYNVDPRDLLPHAANGTTTVATAQDIARVEHKIDLMLDHLGILPLEPNMPDAPEELTELLPDTERPQPRRAGHNGTRRR